MPGSVPGIYVLGQAFWGNQQAVEQGASQRTMNQITAIQKPAAAENMPNRIACSSHGAKAEGRDAAPRAESLCAGALRVSVICEIDMLPVNPSRNL